MSDEQIILSALAQQLDTARMGVRSALWNARSDVEGESRMEPREAAPRAIKRITDAVAFYDQVKALYDRQFQLVNPPGGGPARDAT